MTTSRGRSPVVLGVAAVAVVLGAVAITRHFTRPDTGETSGLQVTKTSEPPPDDARPRTEEERLRRLLDVLLESDLDDALWARNVLARGGEDARRLVAETAGRSLGSNHAFVEHAFDFLLVAPRDEDVSLAVRGLASADPEVVKRALILLGAVRTDASRAAIPQIAAAAEGPWPVPLFALDSLVAHAKDARGEGAAVDELIRIVRSPETLEGTQEQALVRLGQVAGERCRRTLVEEFESAGSAERKRAAAEGLVTMGDPTPLAWLRTQFLEQGDELALTLLARARDDAAFDAAEKRLLATIETEDRRLQAISFLRDFDPARRAPVLRHSAAEGQTRDVRVEAWALLVAGHADELADVIRMLHAEGDQGREDRMVAALVLPRFEKPEVTAAMLRALDANPGDEELRILLLRGLVLLGDPTAAEAVVRAMATDRSQREAATCVADEVQRLIVNARPEFRRAAAPALERALRGEFGEPGTVALQCLVLSSGACCTPSVAPLVEPLLLHRDASVREAAAIVLATIPGPDSEAALRTAWWRPEGQDAFTRAALSRAIRRVVLLERVR